VGVSVYVYDGGGPAVAVVAPRPRLRHEKTRVALHAPAGAMRRGRDKRATGPSDDDFPNTVAKAVKDAGLGERGCYA